MLQKPEKKLLCSRQEIQDYYGISETVYYLFVEHGLPVRKINGRVYAYTENINEWLKKNLLPGPDVDVSENSKKPAK